MNYRIHSDGTVDLLAGDIALLGGYPAVDGVPVRPVSVSAGENSVSYALSEDRRLELSLSEGDDGALLLRCAAFGLGAAHDISPLAGLTLEGCDRAFYQGSGMGRPTGFEKVLPAPSRSVVHFGGEAARPIARRESDGVFAAGNDAACVTLHVCDQRRFRSHFALEGDRVDILFDTEGALREGETLPAVVVREGTDFSSALARCAREIALEMKARTPTRPAFHWCSWYYLYHTLDQATLEEYLAGFNAHRDVAPFRHIQIDAGYFPAVGDWLEPCERFPKGLEYAAKTIRDAGFEPGIWIGPFMVGEESKLFKEHPDWILKDQDGKPMPVWHFYNEPKLWGYRDSEYYALDTSHPDAMAHMQRVFETLRGWGYTLFKTDFMFWGLQDSTRVKRYAPGKTSVEYFRDFLAMVREAIGDAAWLGCIAPFMPFLGYADMMRIGGDVGAQWNDTGFGPENMIMEILGTQYFSNVYWQNDPDAVLLRDFHISLTGTQIEALALLQATSGGVITTSDPVHRIAPERRALLRLIRPNGVVHPSFPRWQQGRPEIVIVNRTARGSVVFLMNPTRDDRVVEADWKAWLGDGARHLYRLHGGPSTPADTPCVALPARSGALFFAADAPIETEPDNLWDWASHAQ